MKTSLLLAAILACLTLGVTAQTCLPGEWSEFSVCNFDTPVQTRTRQTGGEAFITKEGTIPVCKVETETQPCSVNCLLSEWVNDKDCVSGVQQQVRNVVSEPLGGLGCGPSPLSRTVNC